MMCHPLEESARWRARSLREEDGEQENDKEQQEEEKPPGLKTSDTMKAKKVDDVDMKSCFESESEAEKPENASVIAEGRSAKHRKNATPKEKMHQCRPKVSSVSRRRSVKVKRRQQATMKKDTMYREGAWYGVVFTTDQVYEQERIDGERGVQPPEQPTRLGTHSGPKGSRGGSTT